MRSNRFPAYAISAILHIALFLAAYVTWPLWSKPLQMSEAVPITIVATASPFVGLFGTVWGIMTAFQAIAIQKNTNLSVVAPAIAQALFATAIGLAAAIPAYIAYNKYSTDASKFTARLEAFADDLAAAVTRRLGAS